MGLPIKYPCGCQIDVWFDYNDEADYTSVYAVSRGSNTFCKRHTGEAIRLFDDMANKLIID